MTVRTMFGVLCVYLLIGVAFAFAYGIVSAAEEGAFFAQMEGGDHVDFLYFSFVDPDHDRLRRPDRRRPLG